MCLSSSCIRVFWWKHRRLWVGEMCCFLWEHFCPLFHHTLEVIYLLLHVCIGYRKGLWLLFLKSTSSSRYLLSLYPYNFAFLWLSREVFVMIQGFVPGKRLVVMNHPKIWLDDLDLLSRGASQLRNCCLGDTSEVPFFQRLRFNNWKLHL